MAARPRYRSSSSNYWLYSSGGYYGRPHHTTGANNNAPTSSSAPAGRSNSARGDRDWLWGVLATIIAVAVGVWMWKRPINYND